MSYPIPHIDPLDEKLPDDIVEQKEPEITVGDIVDVPSKSWDERKRDLMSLMTIDENPNIIEHYLTEFDLLHNSYVTFHKILLGMFDQKI